MQNVRQLYREGTFYTFVILCLVLSDRVTCRRPFRESRYTVCLNKIRPESHEKTIAKHECAIFIPHIFAKVNEVLCQKSAYLKRIGQPIQLADRAVTLSVPQTVSFATFGYAPRVSLSVPTKYKILNVFNLCHLQI